jgi:hypothetical protein
MTEEEVVAFAGSIQLWWTHFSRYWNFPEGNVCVRRYELFMCDPEEYLGAIELLLGITIKPDTRASIVDKFSFENNKRLVRFTDAQAEAWQFEMSQPPQEIPGRHCHDGEVGCWRKFVPNKLRRLMLDLVDEPLTNLGYNE